MDVARTSPVLPPDPITLSSPSHTASAQNRAVSEAVKTLNDNSYFGQYNQAVFRFDKESRLPVVEIIDSRTMDVIRQIPPKYVLEVAKEIDRATRRDR